MSGGVSEDDLDLLFRRARTAYFYEDRQVPHQRLQELWDLAKWGPTASNSMPARIVWCTSAEGKAKLAKCASSGNRPRILAAPVVAVVGMDLEFYEQLHRLYPTVDARSWFVGNEQLIRETALRNSSLQGAYLIIAARAVGLAAGPMSGFDNAAVDAGFFGGTSIKSNFIMTLGYPDPETYRTRGPRLSFDEANSFA